MALFRAIQVETPTALGPPDGRYLVRPGRDTSPSHVVHLGGKVATIISVGEELPDAKVGAQWLKQAGEEDLTDGLKVLGRVVHSFRLVIADPYLHPPVRSQLVSVKAGYGDGDSLANGRLPNSREISPPKEARRFFTRRSKVLDPEARLSAALAGREPTLVCEELSLRAHHDVDYERWREAALQLLVALDAAVAELSVDASGAVLAPRIDELRERREAVAAAAQSALAGPLSEFEQTTVTDTLGRIEAVFRARAVANA